jgi:type 1 fimbriae regulatory protein FimB/type 1 fimbriae regulatory protein FimE
MTAKLKLVEPRHVNRQVAVRPPNAELRPREYLTVAEVEAMIKAAKAGRHGHRDATLVLVAFRHGLRAAEIAGLQWSQVEFGRNAALHVRRVKNGTPSVHPLQGDELRALRELQRQFPDSGYVFTSERGGPFHTDAVNLLVKGISKRAGLPFSTFTCCGTPAVMRWPMRGMTRGASKAGSGTGRSSTRCVTRNCRLRRSRPFGSESA